MNAPTVAIDGRRCDAVLFDMDGVVTDSATRHAAAWTELFDAFLAARTSAPGENTAPFTMLDYERHVDGKPRYSGVADFLASRGISLPDGEPADPGDAQTVCGLGNRKDQLFLERIAREGVPAFASTVALVRTLRGAGIGTAVFSASRNCARVLEAAGIGDLFAVRVDGLDAEILRLPGKPDPATMFEAALRLHADPERTVVVEDAEAGVAAGRSGGFGLVVGVDRVGHAGRLLEHGADVVVADLAEIEVRNGFRRMSEVPDASSSWWRIADRLDADTPAVLLDFDGTLSDIVAAPDTARLVDGAADALARLVAHCPVAIISGRDLDDLRTRVGVPGIWYVGSHGFELLDPEGTVHVHDAGASSASALAAAAAELGDALRDIPGVRVEHKRFAVAIHYRGVPARQVAAVSAAAHAARSRAGLRITHGRKVVELRPDIDWDKGKAVGWILDHLAKPVVPLYIGDDLTDEDAFDAVTADGIPVMVRHPDSGDRRTAAHFAVDSPARVRDLLDRVVAYLADGTTSHVTESWVLAYDGYDPATERLREALCTVGNGYLATRGAAPESRAGEHHYPGTYIAGIYNRLTDVIAGQAVANESLVNMPNWLPVTWRVDGGDWFDIDSVEILFYRQEFDLRRAVLTRRFRYRDGDGRLAAVTQRRVAAMHEPHLCAMETTVTAENWHGRITVRSVVDTDVRNALVARYRDLACDHLTAPIVFRPGSRTVVTVVGTNQSHVALAVAARTIVQDGTEKVMATARSVDESGSFGHDTDVVVGMGETVAVTKFAAVVTGRDHAVSAPEDQAVRLLDRVGEFDDLLADHAAAWESLWGRLRIDLDSSATAARTLRLHLLHLAQTLSPHTIDLDVGVPARGLHGEAYRGHVFWDELFVLPVLDLRFPALTRALLHYRYRRLPEARRLARENGCAGALFPWQSGSDGREESQRLHLNPRSGHWNPDPSRRAHHAGIAVAHTAWQYYQVTGDREFLADIGTELLVEIARFWASSATYDPADDRYHLRGVIGPDEFHSGYPHAPYDGIDDNAYTNVMASWVIRRAHEALHLLAPRTRAELLQSLRITPAERAHWNEVADRLFVPFHDEVISQFAGYHELAELDWDDYHHRYGDIQRLDRILEAEGDDVNRYRAAKQADVLMLFYLLSADELRDLLGHMGYDLPGDMIPRTVDYYLARTSHGSTLSAVVHAWVLARANRDHALDFFTTVLESDVTDIQGGTTAEGIHLAAMAGSIDLLQRCFTGLEIRDDRLILNPHWPPTLGTLTFPITYRGHRLTLRIGAELVEVASEPGDSPPIDIEYRGKRFSLAAGGVVRLLTDLTASSL
ncbi:trehalose-phosphatase [Nocardia terpenica]|uniref:Trehalose-phosphatase n=1 Tax=Nocardia terpenica TaxID=455432 RepID=A0A164NU00_9NOCA|nr:trehalose-phosphatase [Nocardia terpenica]KZM74722.1 trehalose-phosphatase [Nocardia terpenica]NQE93660.1 trehalose-phosphatase [Nocardia terpenica]